MKQSFTKGITMLLAACVLSIASCDKKKDEVIPDLPGTPPVEEEKPGEPGTPPVETNETCSVSQMVFRYEGYDDDPPIKLTYNEQGYVTGLSKTEVDSDGNTDVYTGTFIYDGNNQLIKQENYTNGKMNDYITYEYQNGLKVSAKHYEYIEGRTEGELMSAKTYRYDDDKRVSEISEDHAGSGSFVVKTRYTYDENDNVIEALEYVNDEPESKIIYSDYDDKPTPYSVMKGLLLSDEDALSKNNVGRRVVFYTHDSKVSTNVSYIWSFTYEYDSNGYPAKITRIDDMRDKDVRVFTYDCK